MHACVRLHLKNHVCECVSVCAKNACERERELLLWRGENGNFTSDPETKQQTQTQAAQCNDCLPLQCSSDALCATVARSKWSDRKTKCRPLERRFLPRFALSEGLNCARNPISTIRTCIFGRLAGGWEVEGTPGSGAKEPLSFCHEDPAVALPPRKTLCEVLIEPLSKAEEAVSFMQQGGRCRNGV